MPTYAGNAERLVIDGVTVDAFFEDVNLEFSNNSVDITAGSNVKHHQRAPGLNDTKIKITITYDVTSIQSYIQHIATGQVVIIEHGPEGSTSGKPRHVQSFNIASVSHTESSDKKEVTFVISGDGADAPTVDMQAGAVYP